MFSLQTCKLLICKNALNRNTTYYKNNIIIEFCKDIFLGGGRGVIILCGCVFSFNLAWKTFRVQRKILKCLFLCSLARTHRCANVIKRCALCIVTHISPQVKSNKVDILLLRYKQFKSKVVVYITEKYRPVPGLEPRASRLTYERATIELSRSIQFCYLSLGFFLMTLVSYRVCGAVSFGGGGCRCGTCM